MGFFSFLFQKQLSQEAYIAYYHRLPESINVRWFRDGDYIVGEVTDGKKKFFTQGKGVDNFIEMVNDALITVYDIPSDYIEVIKNTKAFQPNHAERLKLKDLSVQKSIFGSKKKSKRALQLA